MDDALAQLIATEEAKLRVLEREVAARRQRVEALKTAQRSLQQSDDLDALLTEKIGTDKAPAVQPASADTPFELTQPKAAQAVLRPQAEWPFPTKAAPTEVAKRQVHKRGEVKNALLAVLTVKPKHLNQIMEDAGARGFDLTYDRIRTQLWSYKVEGLVDNPDKGFYGLTPKGKAYVDGLKGESPVGAGLSGATSDVSDLT